MHYYLIFFSWFFMSIHYVYAEYSSSRVDDVLLRSRPSVLYVWAGQDISVSNAADFVAVIDFDENSPTYGHILKTAHLSSDATNAISQARNEAHHSAVSSDRRFFISGGLLSFLSGTKEVFVWRVSNNPRDGPKFAYALDVPGACADEFLPVGDSNFIVSMLCNTKGTSPGDMVFINAEERTAKSIIKNASGIADFNPHGFGRLPNGSIFVSDFIDPSTLFADHPSQIIFRNTARHFFPDGTLERTYRFTFPSESNATAGIGQGLGFMELKSITGDPYGRSITCGTTDNKMYLIGPGMPESIMILDLSQINEYKRILSAGIITIFANGKRLLMTFQMRFVVLLNIEVPEHPTILQVFDFCTDNTLNNVIIGVPGSERRTTFMKYCVENNNVTGAHVVLYEKGERRFLVLNYFLNFGLAKYAGTCTIHSFKLNDDMSHFEYDHGFNPNYDDINPPDRKRTTMHSLRGYPHHAQYLTEFGTRNGYVVILLILSLILTFSNSFSYGEERLV